MMMKYKLANKQNKRICYSDISSEDNVIRPKNISPASPVIVIGGTRQPEQGCFSSDSGQEDSSSVASSSSSSDSIGTFLFLQSHLPQFNGPSPFDVVRRSTKLPLPSDICFAPISVKRRLSFDTPLSTALDGRDWFSPPPPPTKAALVSPRLTPDFTFGDAVQEQDKQEENDMSFPPAIYIPTTDEQEAATLLMALKKENRQQKGPLIFTPPKRRPPPMNNRLDMIFGDLTNSVDTHSHETEDPPKKKRKLDRSVVENCKLLHNKATTGVESSTRTLHKTDKHPVKSSKHAVRLAMADDSKELNSLHCFVRSDLLEVFVMDEHTRKQRHSAPRVGFRCVYCGHLSRRDKEGASMSIFYPKSLQDIYRSVCTWQRIHFKACRHVPQELVERYDYLKEMDRTRGKKQHWVRSAYRLGLRDIDNNRGGIVWDPSSL